MGWKNENLNGIIYPEYYDFNIYCPYDMAIKDEPIIVTCFGTNNYKPNATPTIRPNGRKDYQLLFVVSGEMKIVLDGTTHILDQNSMVLYPPQTPQIYAPNNSQYTTQFIHFTGSDIEELLEQYSIPTGITKFDLPIYPFEDIIKRMYASAKFIHRKKYCNTLLLELFLIISSNIYSNTNTDSFKRLLLYMEENCCQNLPINYYAKFIGFNKEYFIRFFKKNMGMPPHKYLIKLKLEESCRLLSFTEYPIKKIAFLTGYSDINSFCKAFKLRYNMTPSEFRSSKSDKNN